MALHATRRLMVALTLLTPVLGYAMSRSFRQSDGGPFFFLSHVPEILPRNGAAFTVFQALRKYSAYLLLTSVALHVAGTLNHRLQDRNGPTDMLPRMWRTNQADPPHARSLRVCERSGPERPANSYASRSHDRPGAER